MAYEVTTQTPLQAGEASADQYVEAFTVGMTRYTPLGFRIFRKLKVDKISNKFVMNSAMGGMTETAQGADYNTSTFNEVGEKNLLIKQYTDSLEIPELFDETTRGLALEKAMEMGHYGTVLQDYLMASVFQNAFISTGVAGITINGTAYPLCGDAQAIGDTGSTQDNLLTSALSENTLEEAYGILATQKNSADKVVPIPAKLLVVGQTLARTALKLTQSTADTGDNKNSGVINYFKGLQTFVWALLENPTEFSLDIENNTQAELKNNWFLLGDTTKNPFVYIETAPLTISAPIKLEKSNNTLYKVRMTASVGAIDYYGVVGSNVA